MNSELLSQIGDEKKELRRRFLDLRSRLSVSQRQEWDAQLLHHLQQSPLYRQSDVLLVYFPIKGEPNVLSVAEQAVRDGKTVGFPISHPQTHTLSFHAVSDWHTLSPGAYGIPEPPASAPTLNDAPRALCLVPGLAFDRCGFRLGYGSGYYDRFLKNFGGTSLALLYEAFLCNRLPRYETDLPVQHIFTEKGEEALDVSDTKSPSE